MKLLERNCSICASKEFVEMIKQRYQVAVLGDIGYTQKTVICKKCGFTYNNPAPFPETLAYFYSAFSNYENPQRNGGGSEAMLNKWNRTYALIENKFASKFKGNVLEIGCATGMGLSLFKSRGWNVLGIEPSPKAVKLARELYDVEVVNGLFDPKVIADKSPFDVIILSHVIEHLLSPEILIQELIPLLSENGLVYIEVPNLIRPFVPMGYFTFEHLNYFTPITLSSLMELNGFHVEIELFDNSAEIEPFYPVIGAFGRKSQRKMSYMKNDFEAAFAAVEDYKKTSGKEVGILKSKLNFIRKSTKPGRLGIWGGGLHTSLLLSVTNLPIESVACIFENDLKKHGKRVKGIKIIGLEKPEDAAKLVDVIVISSKASEDEIFDQISFLEESGIKVYKLYS